MEFLGEEQAQSVQIGAVILFATLIILLSTYQAFVVPDQNREIEFKHSQSVQNDMTELRSAVISAADGRQSSVSVQLGTAYPSRALFVNPGPPSGQLRSVWTTKPDINVTVENATMEGDAGSFWDGTAKNYSTGEIVYRPNYNEYQDPPQTVYSNTVVVNQFNEENLTLSGQQLIDDRTITLVALNGSLSEARSGSASVDITPVSASDTRVAVTNTTGENLRLEVPTTLDNETWTDLLDDEERVISHEVGTRAGDDTPQLNVTLEQGVTYNLKMAEVGLGSSVETSTSAAYLTKTSGDGTVVPTSENITLEVQARDKYNNPVSGESIQANVTAGSIGDNVTETDGEGIATFDYQAPSSVSAGSQSVTVNVSLDSVASDSSFSPDPPRNVAFDLTIDGSSASSGNSGAYAVEWTQPTDSEVTVCPTSPPQGRCQVGSTDLFLYDVDLSMTTVPTVDTADVEYGVSNRSAVYPGTISGTTDASGQNGTHVFPLSNGTEYVYTSTGGDGDRLELDTTADSSREGQAVDPTTDSADTEAGVEFQVTNDADRALTVTEIWIDPENTDIGRLDDPVVGEGQWQSEFYFDVDGTSYTADFGGGESVPFQFDLSEGDQANDEPIIGPGETMTVDMFRFETDGGSPVNMSDETVEMSFTFDRKVPSSSANMTKNFTVGAGTGGSTSSVVFAGNATASATDADSDGNRGAVSFDITNNGPTSRTITDMEIDTDKSSARRVFEFGGPGQWDHEVTIATADEGYADEGYAYTLGNRVVADGYEDEDTFENEITSGETATVYIYQFQNNGGSSVDMQGSTVDITLYLQNGEQVTFTVQV